jgi:hypothetical protein
VTVQPQTSYYSTASVLESFNHLYKAPWRRFIVKSDFRAILQELGSETKVTMCATGGCGKEVLHYHTDVVNSEKVSNAT